MKRLAFFASLFLAAGLALAQTPPFNAPLTISYQLPTQNTDASALTGQFALTRVQVFLSAAPIADTSTMQPTAEVTTGLGQPISRTFSIVNGGTIHVRLKACHQFGCSGFSNEGTKVAQVPGPGLPTVTTITITIT